MDSVRIKHSIRNTLIMLLGAMGLVWLYGSLQRRSGPLVRIVVFHDVPDRMWFESMIKALSQSYNVISPHDFHAGKLDATQINVLVTFDDGYASWQTIALPVLTTYNVTGLFFINSGLVDVAEEKGASAMFMKEQLLISPKEAISWGGVRALMEAGHSIGGHAHSHANLATLSGEELRHEIMEDKKIIEERIGLRLKDFAYPFGTRAHVNKEVVEAIQNVGYTYAYTAVSRFATCEETFTIPRMCIESGQSALALRRWVRGGYDLFDMLKNICAR